MYAKKFAVAALLATMIFGAVYGLAAALDISGVQILGSGVVAVNPGPPVTKVKWVMDTGDLSLVDGVKIEFASGYTVGDYDGVFVQVYDDGTMIAHGSALPVTQTEMDSEVIVTFHPENIPAENIDYIEITIAGT